MQQVQSSTHAEILSDEEQQLADSSGDSFLTQLGADTPTELVAMSSVTDQLPHAPLQAFANRKKNAPKHIKTHNNNNKRRTTTTITKNNNNIIINNNNNRKKKKRTKWCPMLQQSKCH